MKTKITLILLAFVFGFNTSYGQQDEECMNNLSIFSSYAKNKKYDEAYEPWMKVRTKCPGFNAAVYAKTKKSGGQDLLLYKIKNTSGGEQINHVRDLLKLYEEYNQYYGSKYPKGKMVSDIANLSYKYRTQLGLSDEQLYKIFDDGYTEHLKDFKNAQALLTYFNLKVKAFDKGSKSTSETQSLFDKYDDINDKIEYEVGKASEGLNKIIKKEDSGGTLTKKEGQYKRFYQQNLNAFEQISGTMDTEISTRATCDVLIPLYQKDFEENKNDTKWLQRAMNKMGQKDCTDDPMFEKLVAQKNTVQPDATTAYYLGVLNEKKGNMSEANKYYAQAESLETDPLKKWKFVYARADKNRKAGRLGKARQLYREALKLNPSNRNPYLRIAGMYAKSANNCGTDAFAKRAVYWAAANEAAKAGASGSSAVKRYKALAPDKTMIFSKGMNSGDPIKIGCWIGLTVRVP
jgi:tetratricopeptide (TPR) repeat protein